MSRFVPTSLRPHPRSVRPSVRPGAFQQRLDSIGKSTPTLTGDVFVVLTQEGLDARHKTETHMPGRGWFLPVRPRRLVGCCHATRWSTLVTALLVSQMHAEKFVDLATIIPYFDKVLSGN